MLFRTLQLLPMLAWLVLQDSGAADDSADDTNATGDRDGATGTDDTATQGKDRRGNRDEALARMGEQRDAAREKAATLEAELAQLRKEKQEREEAEAADRGNWKELAEKREASLTETTGKLTAATERLQTLEAYVKADIEAVSKAVKDAAKDNDVAAVLQDIHPGDDADVTALIAWLGKAKPRLAAMAATERQPGHREDKKGDPKIPPNTEADKAARARMRPRL